MIVAVELDVLLGLTAGRGEDQRSDLSEGKHKHRAARDALQSRV
jgi:hypothetical protein